MICNVMLEANHYKNEYVFILVNDLMILLLVVKILIICEGIMFCDPPERIIANIIICFADYLRNALIFRYLLYLPWGQSKFAKICRFTISFFTLGFSLVISGMEFYSIITVIDLPTYSSNSQQKVFETLENALMVVIYLPIAKRCHYVAFGMPTVGRYFERDDNAHQENNVV